MRLEARNGEPITTVQDWFRLAPPMGGALQWRDGRSAKELAKAWCSGDGEPEPPQDLFALLATNTLFGLVAPEIGYPERRVRFDQVRGEPRNTDLAVVCETLGGPLAVSIEAKVDESFGRTVGEEILNAAAQWAFAEKPGKLKRIESVVNAVLPRWRPGQAEVGQLRYQLLTATAGAWAFAEEVGASRAALVIHEFVGPRVNQARLDVNRRDFDRFVDRVTEGADTTLGYFDLVGPLPVPRGEFWPGVDCWYLGKCRTELTAREE